MNGLRWVVPIGILLIVAALPTRGVAAPAAASNPSAPALPTLPASVRQTANPAAVRPQIQQFINERMTALTGADPEAQKQARQALILPVQTVGTVTPTAEFLRAYVDVLGTALEPAVKNPDPRIRLNLAVSAARVVEQANSASPAMVRAVVAMLNDDSEAVALWGMKAAKHLVPGVLSGGAVAKNNPLIPAIVATGKKYSNSGAMTFSAYEALRIDNALKDMTPAVKSSAIHDVVAAMHEIMEKRLNEFVDGIPDGAPSESWPILFLTTTEDVWKKQAPEQQIKTVQLISDLIGLASQRIAADPNIKPSEKQDVAVLLGKAGQGLIVLGKYLGSSTDVAAMNAAAQSLSSVTPSISTTDLRARADLVYPGLIKIRQFKDLTPPPKLSDASKSP